MSETQVTPQTIVELRWSTHRDPVTNEYHHSPRPEFIGTPSAVLKERNKIRFRVGTSCLVCFQFRIAATGEIISRSNLEGAGITYPHKEGV